MPPSKDSSDLVRYLKTLRDRIISEFEALEEGARFHRTAWEHHTGGGGEISLLRGKVFEKAAVNWSGVSGGNYPLDDTEGAYFATGISVITHMCNPHAPTVHFNLRFIATMKHHWFGGGYDLTPMGFPYEEDTGHFHNAAKAALETFDPGLYPRFSQNAKEYFYIPHRRKERGIGGIFFDHYHTGSRENDIKLWESVGDSFLGAVVPIYNRRVKMPFSQADREIQGKCRAHYVEFNLLYDRGTKFGFQSGGNPEAILCSMPPSANW